MATSILGLRTVVYRVGDLAAAKRFYPGLLGREPYLDEPFYVGYNASGCELGLDPDPSTPPGPGGTVPYWGVTDVDRAAADAVADPSGNLVGLIHEPHFKLD